MTVTYKVLVIRTESPRRALLDSGSPRRALLGSGSSPALVETLFEAGGPDAGRLLAYAPAEVAAALAAAGRVEVPAASVAEPDEPDAPAVNPEGHYRSGGESAEQPAGSGELAPAKRKRRTKAEIAADKAREAQLSAGPNGPGVGDEPASAHPAVDAPTPEPQPIAAPAPEQQPAPAAAATGAPYNPFA